MKTYRKRRLIHFKKYIIIMSFLSILTAILMFLCINFSVLDIFSPVNYVSTASANELLHNNSQYAVCNADTLYYTGYDYHVNSKIKGHYYYSLNNEICTIYLISTKTTGDITPVTLNNINFTCKIINEDSNLEPLLKYMANDMNWNYYGISHHASSVILSECDYHPFTCIFIGICSILIILIDIIFLTYILVRQKKAVT